MDISESYNADMYDRLDKLASRDDDVGELVTALLEHERVLQKLKSAVMSYWRQSDGIAAGETLVFKLLGK